MDFSMLDTVQSGMGLPCGPGLAILPMCQFCIFLSSNLIENPKQMLQVACSDYCPLLIQMIRSD